LRIGRRSRTVYVGQAHNSANRVLFIAGLVHRRVSRVVRGWRLTSTPSSCLMTLRRTPTVR
jgi:hypothetical protein